MSEKPSRSDLTRAIGLASAFLAVGAAGAGLARHDTLESVYDVLEQADSPDEAYKLAKALERFNEDSPDITLDDLRVVAEFQRTAEPDELQVLVEAARFASDPAKLQTAAATIAHFTAVSTGWDADAFERLADLDATDPLALDQIAQVGAYYEGEHGIVDATTMNASLAEAGEWNPVCLDIHEDADKTLVTKLLHRAITHFANDGYIDLAHSMEKEAEFAIQELITDGDVTLNYDDTKLIYMKTTKTLWVQKSTQLATKYIAFRASDLDSPEHQD